MPTTEREKTLLFRLSLLEPDVQVETIKVLVSGEWDVERFIAASDQWMQFYQSDKVGKAG